LKLSVVVPCYNEATVLDRLVSVLKEQLPAVASDFEVILVDDGSRDRTLEIMRETADRDVRFRYLSLSRNFGKESAMLAGISQARGDAVAIMDADLQHPPHLLAEMVPYLDAGYDQVVARRTRTGDPALRTLVSRLFYRVMNKLIDVRLEDGVGDFRVLSRTAVRGLLALGEYNRFSKGLFSWIGFKTATVDYENVVRESGQSKWRLRDLLNYGIDAVLSFNTRPLRMAIHFGIFVSAAAFLYALWVIGAAIVGGVSAPGYVTIVCAVVGFGGLHMVLLGIIGEYVGRIYAETKGRPHFLVQETSEGPDAPIAVALGFDHLHDADAYQRLDATSAALPSRETRRR
jgi:glycosyltransferase involved in cell wall biosynthesis